MADDEIASGFLFPYMIAFLDLLHICFNGFEEGAKCFPEWHKLEKLFAAFVSFLSDRGLRYRFLHYSVKDARAKVRLQKWNINAGFNWKWEYMAKFMTALTQLWSDLTRNTRLNSQGKVGMICKL